MCNTGQVCVCVCVPVWPCQVHISQESVYLLIVKSVDRLDSLSVSKDDIKRQTHNG